MQIKITLGQLRILEQDGKLYVADGIELVLEKPKNTATGAEIRDFFTDHWDLDYYHEYDCAKVQIQDEQGEWLLQDDKMYDLSQLGDLCWQGSAEHNGKPSNMTFEEAFLKWKGIK